MKLVDDEPAPAPPPGRYAGGGRSPIVYTWLCPACGGYSPVGGESETEMGCCQGCGTDNELHKFQSLILSAANGGCMCEPGYHPQVTGDLPDEGAVAAVLLEVQTRPAPRRADGGS